LNFKFKLNFVKTITLVEFRKNAQTILRRVEKGERLLLSRRGKPSARLEPISAQRIADADTDPLLTIGKRATPSPKGKTLHADIDRILYGRR
jgi:prevent-host-death family protein